jgi:hypothetical protein
MAAKPSLISFVRAFSGHWFAAMSGPLGVMLAVAAVFITDHAFALCTGGAGLLCVVFASYRVWRSERIKVIQLEKVNQYDLQHMMGGRYLGDTFIYSADIAQCCRNYDTAFKMRELAKGFDVISVRAPRLAIANLKFSFMHERGALYKFYIKDRNGERPIEDIYGVILVALDDVASFSLKMSVEDDFAFEKSSLIISVYSWSK